MALGILTLTGLLTLTVLGQIKPATAQLRARRPRSFLDIGNTATAAARASAISSSRAVPVRARRLGRACCTRCAWASCRGSPGSIASCSACHGALDVVALEHRAQPVEPVLVALDRHVGNVALHPRDSPTYSAARSIDSSTSTCAVSAVRPSAACAVWA